MDMEYKQPDMTDNRIILRKIKISKYNQKRIGLIIGKEGSNFYNITKKCNLLYLYYRDENIEIYGYNMQDISVALDILTKQIRILNMTGQLYYDIDNMFTIGDCQRIDFELMNKGGQYWCKAYGNPKANDTFKIEIQPERYQKFIAKNVGIFTFNLEKEENEEKE